MKKLSLRIWLPVLFLLLIACGTSQDNGLSESEPVEETVVEEAPDQESWQSTVIISENGRLVAEVWANYIAVYNKQKRTYMKDSIHVDFYNREGKHNAVLTADAGTFEQQTQNLTALGNVIVVSDSGVVLETEALMWDNKQQKIISEVPVKFMNATDTLYGDSFISDPDMINYDIKNPRGYSRRAIPVEEK